MRVFVSFDDRYDNDLYELFIAQSLRSGSLFKLVADGPSALRTRDWSDTSREGIRSADEVVFLCGEHTNESLRMSAELDITREEKKPYIFVWGRRESMCTKPDGAFSADSMYSWTREILENQMSAMIRDATPRIIPESCKRQPQHSRRAKTPLGKTGELTASAPEEPTTI